MGVSVHQGPLMSASLSVSEFFKSFSDLRHTPRAFWYVIGAFVWESMAYFGMLLLMTLYLTADLGWSDGTAGLTVSLFTASVTLFMLGAGSYAERFGLRRAILFALAISTLARVFFSYSADLGETAAIVAVAASLFVISIGSAILQPVCYSGVKQYTDERTSAMGYGLIYALMNLGIVVVAGLSVWIRPGVDALHEKGEGEGGVLDALFGWAGSGVQAVNWLCVGLTAFTFVAFFLLMTKRAEAEKLRPDRAAENPPEGTLCQRLWRYFADGPFGNARFIFFIFMLLPVRTLFAHQWLTMPQYIIRAYPQGVGDYMEILINWINPLIIFIGVPILTALTKRVHVYTVMMIGTLISAAPTFLLVGGPSLGLLITYFVIFSLGEALWSARFLEYASELAPEGKIAQYMGLANIPWLLAKATTGIYSGWMLATYCPEDVPKESLDTSTMWLIYGVIAMTTPIGLWLARRWVMSGLDGNSDADAGASEAATAADDSAG